MVKKKWKVICKDVVDKPKHVKKKNVKIRSSLALRNN